MPERIRPLESSELMGGEGFESLVGLQLTVRVCMNFVTKTIRSIPWVSVGICAAMAAAGFMSVYFK